MSFGGSFLHLFMVCFLPCLFFPFLPRTRFFCHKARSYARSKTQIENENGVFRSGFFDQEKKLYIFFLIEKSRSKNAVFRFRSRIRSGLSLAFYIYTYARYDVFLPLLLSNVFVKLVHKIRHMRPAGAARSEAPVNNHSFVAQPLEAVSADKVRSCSTIGEGRDTTIPSPWRSPKQPLPGIGLHDPLRGWQACPEFNSFHQGVGQIYPR